jgi:hypothetical protein
MLALERLVVLPEPLGHSWTKFPKKHRGCHGK